MAKEKEEKKCKCGCGETLEEDCNCKEKENCECCEECTCGDDCKCDENNKCSKDCKCGEKETNYLNDLLRVQAEFDNYRKRMQTALGDARNDGFMDAIEQFIPALDSFKMATDMITDKNTLIGIQFIEKGILDTLNKMGVELISATGKFNPELHHVIDTTTQEGFEKDEIVKEVYRGFTYKGKVIRYSQVVVAK